MQLIDHILTQADSLRAGTIQRARSLRDFTRRLELILSQEHKHIAIRDTDFQADFTRFSAQSRADLDQALQTWQDIRMQVRSLAVGQEPSSLQAKSFSLRAKTLSRACDDLTTAYDQFMFFYKSYTSAKLPVWIVTSCCDDTNNLAGKILFLSREVIKKAEQSKGG